MVKQSFGKTMSDLKVGDSAIVEGYAPGSRAYRQKLLAMGLTPGIEVKILRQAPLGDPIEIGIRGYSLSLRKKESQLITVRVEA